MASSFQSTSNFELNEEAWWVQRWVDLLNNYRFKKRLERGRKYAREGNILNIDYKGAKVIALVQGTAEEPYKLSIWLDAFTDEDWSYVIESLAEHALFSAQLLAGEMPDDIESVFTANGLSLFPFQLSEVHSKCDCPDPKNPCKHIAAVYYQLGDFFREDPFILFQLRGRDRQQILDSLRQKRQQSADRLAEVGTPDTTVSKSQNQKQEQTSLDIGSFWQYEQPLDSSLVVITPSSSTALDRLDNIPLPVNDARVVMAYFRDLYQTVSQKAAMKALSPNSE
ncbi:SWIM zinc finger family protein [Oscillatoria sp. CS-180]|uniref:SWIM zinc finger family protein n=1 Tax=Oscillatoria sp. CS-180 TaxID=3021720 RepID=UPI002330A8D3|nr:SWIM zinc finger family protein [Oscillatoria sp. CS-180]MDB9525685.1 SWIM zinc finger family protein [Oscillatoria sp. CS-180]